MLLNDDTAAGQRRDGSVGSSLQTTESRHGKATVAPCRRASRILQVSTYTVKHNYPYIHGYFVGVFRILTEPVQCTLVSVNRRNNEARCIALA